MKGFLGLVQALLLLGLVHGQSTYERFIPKNKGSCSSVPNDRNVGCLKECQDLCTGSSCVGVLYRKNNKKCKVMTQKCDVSGYRFYEKEEITASSCGTKNYNLIWVLDESGSVGQSNFNGMERFVVDVSASLSHNTERILKSMKVLTFSYWVDEILDKTSDFCKLENEVFGLSYDEGQTNIHDALTKAKFFRETEFPVTEKTIVILLTDGKPTRWGEYPFLSSRDETSFARSAGEALAQLGNTDLIYGKIIGASDTLFSGIPDIHDFDVSSWDLDAFVDTLEELIGETVCITDSPTKHPTPHPTKPVPTEKPTSAPSKRPTPHPTTLQPSTCTVLKSGVSQLKYDSADEFVFSNFASFQPVSKSFQMTSTANALAKHNGAHIFYRTKQNLIGGFISSFKVSVSELSQAQGFAFVMTSRPQGIKSIPMSIPLGYHSIDSAIAVVFDLCTNRVEGAGQCLEHEVTVDYNPSPNGRVPDITQFEFKRPFPRQNEYDVRIEYLEQASVLRLYVNNVHLFDQWDFRLGEIIGSDSAFLGFTSGSLDVLVDTTIRDWDVKTVAIAPDRSEGVDLDQTKELIADGTSKEGFTIQTKDVCDYSILFGGHGALLNGVFVEQPSSNGTYANGTDTPHVVIASVQDLDNGQYKAVLSTTYANVSYNFYALYGDGCEYQVTFVQHPTFADLKKAELTPTSTVGCFEAQVVDGITTVEPETAPPPDFGNVAGDVGEETNIGAIAAGGVVATIAFFVAAVAMVRYRNKWRNDKGFIDDGKVFKLERDVEYATSPMFGAISAKLQKSHEDLNRERAQAQKASKEAQIKQLQREQQQLQDEIKDNKIKIQKGAEVGNTSVSSFNPVFSKEKKQFNPSPFDEMI